MNWTLRQGLLGPLFEKRIFGLLGFIIKLLFQFGCGIAPGVRECSPPGIIGGIGT